MSIDFTPCMINTYHGDIYNRTTDTLKDAVFDGIVDIPCNEHDQ